MALNILEALKTQFGDEILGKLRRFIGEDSYKTKTALGAALVAILGGLVSKGSTPQGSSEILDMITKGGFGEDTLKGLESAFAESDTTKNLQNSGTGLLGAIFGDKVSRVIDWICSSSGVGKLAASSLLGLVVPAVLGFLGKEVRGSNLNAGGLMNLLSSQAGFLKAQAPAGLGNLLGMPDLSSLPKTFPESMRQKSSAWKWALPLLILAVVLFYALRSCNAPPVKTPVEKGTTGTGNILDRLGKFLSVELPNGIELNVPELGIERKLIAFIEDTGKPVDKTTWFTFDRLEFETGSANLKPASMEQLKNIAEILKAYPNVTLKLGGYTDNTGNPDANLALSQKRAQSTMNELVKLGVAANRLEAEGYGDKHPVADYATEEGRQRNRRIDVRVTKK